MHNRFKKKKKYDSEKDSRFQADRVRKKKGSEDEYSLSDTDARHDSLLVFNLL